MDKLLSILRGSRLRSLIASIALGLAMAMSFTSCGDDEDDGGTTGSSSGYAYTIYAYQVTSRVSGITAQEILDIWNQNAYYFNANSDADAKTIFTQYCNGARQQSLDFLKSGEYVTFTFACKRNSTNTILYTCDVTYY